MVVKLQNLLIYFVDFVLMLSKVMVVKFQNLLIYFIDFVLMLKYNLILIKKNYN